MAYEQIISEQRDEVAVVTVALDWARSYAEHAAPTDPTTAQRREAALLKAYATREHEQAVAAFLEKRKPAFR